MRDDSLVFCLKADTGLWLVNRIQPLPLFLLTRVAEPCQACGLGMRLLADLVVWE